MTEKTIRETIDELKQEIKARHNLIEQIQEQVCTHAGHEVTPKGDTGNWCKQDDSYWYEHKCHICDKFWTTPQGMNFMEGGVIKRV